MEPRPNRASHRSDRNVATILPNPPEQFHSSAGLVNMAAGGQRENQMPPCSLGFRNTQHAAPVGEWGS